jgi:hypothetical protein
MTARYLGGRRDEIKAKARETTAVVVGGPNWCGTEPTPMRLIQVYGP